MAEYIEREALLRKIRWASTPEECVMSVRKMPAADVEPVVHGLWLPTDMPFMAECEDCSVCGFRVVYGRDWSYCPGCGAKMDEVVYNERIY